MHVSRPDIGIAAVKLDLVLRGQCQCLVTVNVRCVVYYCEGCPILGQTSGNVYTIMYAVGKYR